MNARLSMITLVLSLVACASSPLDECTLAPVDGCDSVETCCNSTACYFLADGQEFPCANGKECDAAVADVKAHCKSTAQ
ncbi:hypothetical protein [Polyangium sorediatum]|uniref:Lipoprotein n=1 Tax=Polyangium sorediatum TaxID=889274 RepID=A0ABT6NWG4_9BACT|nr:hypothetical protein [Polyangium sorediatum]MDI1432685.1 hypothetical protein [Polyangium sorediatum]